MADPSRPTWEIQRLDDDYFLRSGVAIKVNGKPVNSKLLVSGDEIEFSSRCRIRFALPVAASTTAVLKLSGAALPGSDCRTVILLDRDLILAPSAPCHVVVAGLAGPTVLYCRNGQLQLREGLASGGATRVLAMDSPLEMGGMRLVLTAR
jgi:hypothetical protein